MGTRRYTCTVPVHGEGHSEYVGILENMDVRADTLSIDLYYPRNQAIKFVEVGLMDVRAADSIRIEYDFERDGYSIQQASTFEWDIEDEECNSDWQEVAFVQAWAREKKATS
jgi:hypothetical protein